MYLNAQRGIKLDDFDGLPNICRLSSHALQFYCVCFNHHYCSLLYLCVEVLSIRKERGSQVHQGKSSPGHQTVKKNKTKLIMSKWFHQIKLPPRNNRTDQRI